MKTIMELRVKDRYKDGKWGRYTYNHRKQSKENQPHSLESVVSKPNAESWRLGLSSEKNPFS